MGSILAALALQSSAQVASRIKKAQPVIDTVVPEKVSYHFQLTTIGQHQLPFHNPYSGLRSLQSSEELRLSVTSTLFLGARLWKGAEVYLNPELSGGRGISSTQGVAGFPNGEVYRVGNPEPVITIARIFLRQTFSLGGVDRSPVNAGINQLAGNPPANRLVFTLGKYSIADIFDCNTYSHDPRNQFYNWSVMSGGGWDYPANTRGYTYSLAAEIIKPKWSLKLAASMVPETVNGPFLDLHIDKANSITAQFDRYYTINGKQGTVRALVFNTYAHMGNYEEAVAFNPTAPDLAPTRAYNRNKFGFLINAEQAITTDLGMFSRLSWNDGNNETWAFTEIDHSFSLGAVLKGTKWKRSNDVLGLAIAVNGISRQHAGYLAAGGSGFILGDGSLNESVEAIAELYYNCRLFNSFWVSPDYQFIVNPAYNMDRGPVHVFGIRGHVEL